MDLTDIIRRLHLNAEEYIFFSSAHGTFFRIDHILGHKLNLSKFKKFQMFKLVLEKAEEPEIKLPISAGSLKKQ